MIANRAMTVTSYWGRGLGGVEPPFARFPSLTGPVLVWTGTPLTELSKHHVDLGVMNGARLNRAGIRI